MTTYPFCHSEMHTSLFCACVCCSQPWPDVLSKWVFLMGLPGDGIRTIRQWVMGEEEQDTHVCLWLEWEERDWGVTLHSALKTNITLMWFSCSSCQRFGGKLDMVQRINDESAWFCLSTGPLTRCQHLKYFCQHIAMATGKKKNGWSPSVRRLALSPSMWAFTSCCDSPRAILTRCQGFFRPLTVCLWGPEVLVSRPASLHFHFYCSFCWRSITFAVE